MWWPWRRRAEPVVEPAPVSRAEWRTVPPVQRVVPEHPLINSVQRFSDSLTSWRNPSFLEPLGHRIGAAEPSGVADLVTPLPGTLDMPLAQPPRRPGEVAVQRASVTPEAPAEPLFPLDLPNPSVAPPVEHPVLQLPVAEVPSAAPEPAEPNQSDVDIAPTLAAPETPEVAPPPVAPVPPSPLPPPQPSIPRRLGLGEPIIPTVHSRQPAAPVQRSLDTPGATEVPIPVAEPDPVPSVGPTVQTFTEVLVAAAEPVARLEAGPDQGVSVGPDLSPEPAPAAPEGVLPTLGTGPETEPGLTSVTETGLGLASAAQGGGPATGTEPGPMPPSRGVGSVTVARMEVGSRPVLPGPESGPVTVARSELGSRPVLSGAESAPVTVARTEVGSPPLSPETGSRPTAGMEPGSLPLSPRLESGPVTVAGTELGSRSVLSGAESGPVTVARTELSSPPSLPEAGFRPTAGMEPGSMALSLGPESAPSSQGVESGQAPGAGPELGSLPVPVEAGSGPPMVMSTQREAEPVPVPEPPTVMRAHDGSESAMTAGTEQSSTLGTPPGPGMVTGTHLGSTPSTLGDEPTPARPSPPANRDQLPLVQTLPTPHQGTQTASPTVQTLGTEPSSTMRGMPGPLANPNVQMSTEAELAVPGTSPGPLPVAGARPTVQTMSTAPEATTPPLVQPAAEPELGSVVAEPPPGPVATVQTLGIETTSEVPNVDITSVDGGVDPPPRPSLPVVQTLSTQPVVGARPTIKTLSAGDIPNVDIVADPGPRPVVGEQPRATVQTLGTEPVSRPFPMTSQPVVQATTALVEPARPFPASAPTLGAEPDLTVLTLGVEPGPIAPGEPAALTHAPVGLTRTAAAEPRPTVARLAAPEPPRPIAAPPSQLPAPPPLVLPAPAEQSPVSVAVQREDTPPAPEPAPAPATPPAPADVTAQAPAAPAAPAAGGDPEELVKKLYDPLLRRLKAELRLDRERHGRLTDLTH